jgi:uncharacterized membrane protein YkvI
MHFQVKSTLKSNHNYTFKQAIWRISQQKQEKNKKKNTMILCSMIMSITIVNANIDFRELSKSEFQILSILTTLYINFSCYHSFSKEEHSRSSFKNK